MGRQQLRLQFGKRGIGLRRDLRLQTLFVSVVKSRFGTTGVRFRGETLVLAVAPQHLIDEGFANRKSGGNFGNGVGAGLISGDNTLS